MAYSQNQTFDPLYTGPIITSSGNNESPGEWCLQPYFFYADNYGIYTHRGDKHTTAKEYSISPQFLVQTGLTKWLDITVTPGVIYKWNSSDEEFGMDAIPVKFGLQFLKEKWHTPRPSMRVTVSESIPVGKYKDLDPNKNGLDAFGAGSFVTSLSLNISKVVFWFPTHPMQLRLNVGGTIPTKVKVTGFNAYGGGYNTDGTVTPGNRIFIDGAFEFSFTRKWVLASDICYHKVSKAKFSGNKGTTATGAEASISLDSSYSFELAPALEYNHSEKFGVLAGAWFSVTGKNSAAFNSAVLSLVWNL